MDDELGFDPSVDPFAGIGQPEQSFRSGQSDNRDVVAKSLIDSGASNTATAAILGDIHQESNFNPRATGDNGTSHGLLQVGIPMFREYVQTARKLGVEPGSPDDAYLQTSFVIDKFKEQHPDRWDAMQNADDPAQALAVFRGTKDWEYGIAGKRYNYAQAYGQLLSGEEIRKRIEEESPPGVRLAGQPTTASEQKVVAAGAPEGTLEGDPFAHIGGGPTQVIEAPMGAAEEDPFANIGAAPVQIPQEPAEEPQLPFPQDQDIQQQPQIPAVTAQQPSKTFKPSTLPPTQPEEPISAIAPPIYPEAIVPSAAALKAGVLEDVPSETYQGEAIPGAVAGIKRTVAESDVPIVPPEYTPPYQIARAAEAALPDSAIKNIYVGEMQGVADVMSGFTTPNNIAMLASSGLLGSAGARILAGVFAGQAATQMPEAWREFNRTNNPIQKARIAARTLAGLGLGIRALKRNPKVRRAVQDEINETIKTHQALTKAQPLQPARETVPQQFQPELPIEANRVTSTKNVVAAAERSARGLAPILEEAVRTNPETMAAAEQRLAANPEYGRSVVGQLITGEKRGIDSVDEAVMLREKINAMNSRDIQGRIANDTTLTNAERSAAKQSFENWENYINEIDQATYKSGREWGRLGQFRQRLARMDYSLANVEQRMRMAKGGEPLTPQETKKLRVQTKQIERAQRRLDAKWDRLEHSIAGKKGLEEVKPRNVSPQLANMEIEMLQVELAKLKASERETNRLPEAKRRTTRRINEIEKRMAEYGYAKESAKAKLVPDKELRDLQFRLAQAKETLDRGIFMERLNHQTRVEKALRITGEILSLPRAIRASGDVSGLRRQGGLFFLGGPGKTLKGFGATIKAIRSKQDFFNVMQEIRERPNYPEYHQSGLSLTDTDPTVGLAKMEEQYQSRWADKIPIVGNSQWQYVAFLNRIRADKYDSLKAVLGKGGEITPEQGKVIANFVNVFTGRGAFTQKMADAAAALNQAFFAPRYRISRLQALIGQPLWTRQKGAGMAVRYLIAKEYAKTGLGLGLLFGTIAAAVDNALELDPRSADFLKLKIGNTRIDFLSGITQALVPLSRIISGKTKTQAGELRAIRGPDVPYGAATGQDIMVQYIRGGFAPVPAAVWDAASGKSYSGQPVTPLMIAENLTVPMSWIDVVESLKEHGVPQGTAIGLASIIGEGVQTYTPRTDSGIGIYIPPMQSLNIPTPQINVPVSP